MTANSKTGKHQSYSNLKIYVHIWKQSDTHTTSYVVDNFNFLIKVEVVSDVFKVKVVMNLHVAEQTYRNLNNTVIHQTGDVVLHSTLTITKY